MKCPYCGSSDFIVNDEGFLVCTNCGAVLNRNVLEEEARYQMLASDSLVTAGMTSLEPATAPTKGPRLMPSLKELLTADYVHVLDRTKMFLLQMIGTFDLHLPEHEIDELARCIVGVVGTEKLASKHSRVRFESAVHTALAEVSEGRLYHAYKLLKEAGGKELAECLKRLIVELYARSLRLSADAESAVRIVPEARQFYEHTLMAVRDVLNNCWPTAKVASIHLVPPVRHLFVLKRIMRTKHSHCVISRFLQHGRHFLSMATRPLYASSAIEALPKFSASIELLVPPDISPVGIKPINIPLQIGLLLWPYVTVKAVEKPDSVRTEVVLDAHTSFVSKSIKDTLRLSKPAVIYTALLKGLLVLKEYLGADVKIGGRLEVKLSEDGQQLLDSLSSYVPPFIKRYHVDVRLEGRSLRRPVRSARKQSKSSQRR